MEKLRHGKKSIPIAQTVVRLLMPYRQTIATITTDNGSEFAAHKMISHGLSIKGETLVQVYFTDALHARLEQGVLAHLAMVHEK